MGRNIVSAIGREAATETKASSLSLQSLGTCSNFQTEKLALFYPGDIFCHSGVQGFEFFVDLPDDQLGITLNQELVDRYGGS